MAKSVSSFRCSECGWTTLKWAGRCGECQQWGTVVDAGQTAGITRKLKAITLVGDGIARPITHVETDAAAHWPTGINEFDRVLGGGIVPGSVILLSGEPGVGKSTLLLEVASKAAAAKSRVLYVSAEESVSQVRLRAERTNALEPELFIAAETDLGVILGQIDAVKPDLIIIDSVQTVSSALSDGSPGMPSQVREVASTLIRVAKDRNLPVLLVGHVTKDGSIAGPRVLEHLVDVVCQFEGDRQTSLRFIRALKNRFGPTDEVGCFEMTGDGIAEVPDPSGLFLSRATEPVDGTCVTVALEGRRAMPVEVQALVTDTQAPNPRRVTSGVDAARVAMLLAVLQERAGMKLSAKDVYVSTVGGIRLTEPAADLAIALAIASAFTGLAVAHNVVAFGEISLAGEVRGALMSKQRVNEAVRLGFTTQIDAACGSIHAAVALALGTSRSPRDAELDRAF
ncbi:MULTISPECIES: DNA repair protein RadA [Cryobacterium]|uniref:DNA repair protein RadA n=1 Tax=Cryobacterium levicorallinum TaxID=995038 RepID=A0A1I3D799_9MICO|nr:MULTISPECIES: DNA repair protein RadA [Cryobacterium]TFB86785.1 DNA repair protein RadA [Cryobacterium levicorallinum]TFD61214.1 DNA repair protein RadA [Cryobacterium sp. Hh38]GEP28180.1 DNA repair protein RadA [Cryobacterium levicorallinum]SFH82381.1 DNA repair protein RadA/Sms [Cryobacterium levicorallinum]